MNAALAWQRDRIRSMTADEKMRLAHGLWMEAWRVTEAGVRGLHPDWTAEAVRDRVRELMRDAGEESDFAVCGAAPPGRRLPVRFAPIEYVIVYKLRYAQAGGSDRHLRDVARMLEISGTEVDRSALEDWIGRLGLEEEWARARSHRPVGGARGIDGESEGEPRLGWKERAVEETR